MEGLVGLAVVYVMTQLDFVSSLLTSLCWRLGPTQWSLLPVLPRPLHNVLGLVCLVDTARAAPHPEVRLRVLGVTVVEVNKKFLKAEAA